MLHEMVVYRPVLVNRNDIIVQYLDGLFSSRSAVIDVLKARYDFSKYTFPLARHKWVQVYDELGSIACAELILSLGKSGQFVGIISMPVKL